MAGAGGQGGTVAAGALHAEALRTGVVRADALQAGVVRGDALQAGALQAGVVRAGVLGGDALQAEALRTGVVRARGLRADALQAGALQAGVVRAGVVRANALQAEALHPDALQADALHPDALQAEALHPDALRDGVVQERNRLAAELHDTVAQGLASMQLLLDAADREWTREPGRARQLVRQAAAAVRENLAEARRLIHDLAPPELDHGSLPQALRGLCAGVEGVGVEAPGVEASGVEAPGGEAPGGESVGGEAPGGESVGGAGVAVAAPGGQGARFRLEGEPRPVAAEVEAAVLRVAQGALANVRRHARASVAVVTLTYQPYALALDVWDDGVGFDPSEPRGGDGLRLLRRRIAYLGGTAAVESTPGGGTVVSVWLPARDPA